MDDLIQKYAPIQGNDAFEMFKQFNTTSDLSHIKKWIKDKLRNKYFHKNNNRSTDSRNRGNQLYKNKRLKDSIEYYNKSLAYAFYNSEEYGKALANRSAASFMMGDFLDALRDINLCLNTEYPRELRPKMYLRKAECSYKLNMWDELENTIALLEGHNDAKITEKLNRLKNRTDRKFYWLEMVPPVANNKAFNGAVKGIRVEFNKVKGRHVIAEENIKAGDLLFVEKAFVFAPIFVNEHSLVVDKCYFCLNTIKYGIPCQSCTACLYCNEKCRDESWSVEHQFECIGMSLWHDLGVALPAFKCLFKGIESGFRTVSGIDKAATEYFGEPTQNYPYFNTLATNLSNMPCVTHLVVVAAVVVRFLKKKTKFFQYLHDMGTPEDYDIVNNLGAALIRHMAQITCNGSIIEHTECVDKINGNSVMTMEPKGCILDFDSTAPVACGIFPSICMMNHSCKSNISIYYIKDVAVIRANEDISAGQEIFNCYGVDYKMMNRQERQEALLSSHYFKCFCEICSDPEKEYDIAHNYYLCVTCEAKLYKYGDLMKCRRCGEMESINKYKTLDQRILNVIDNSNDISEMKQCYKVMEANYSKYHNYMFECLDKLYLLYINKEDVMHAILYKQKCQELLRHTHGPNSKKYGMILEGLCHCEKVCICPEKCMNVLKLYYPIDEMSYEEKPVPRQ